MAAVSAAKRAHATLSTTTADTVTLTSPCKEINVTNHILTAVPLYVTLKTGLTAAAAVGATTAVSAADETYAIPPGATRTIFRSSKRVYVELSVVGNANPYSVEGNDANLGAGNT